LFAGGLRVANSMTVGPELKSEHAQPGAKIPPEMKVVITANARLFHAPGCDVIHNKQTERTITAKEAIQAGYVPCLRCLREYLHTASAGQSESEQVADADVFSDRLHGNP
jgi:hypothetical protein